MSVDLVVPRDRFLDPVERLDVAAQVIVVQRAEPLAFVAMDQQPDLLDHPSACVCDFDDRAAPVDGVRRPARETPRLKRIDHSRIVQHHVSDYDTWYPVFGEHGAVRKMHGGSGHTINRAVDDPNSVVVVNEFKTLDGARAFMADPSLKDAMARAGVDSAPQVWLVDEAESVTY